MTYNKLKFYWRTLNPSGKREFAERCGTTVSYLSQMAHGHRTPSPRMAKRIEAYTERYILAEELLRW